MSNKEIYMAILLRQMLNLHGSKADDWKWTAEWRNAARLVEEEIEDLLSNLEVQS